MSFQVHSPGKLLATLVAAERFFPSVDSPVHLELGRSGKGFLTELAAIGASVVHVLMLFQAAQSRERLLTLVTSEHGPARVRLHVLLHVIGSGETLPTLLTCVRFFSGVDAPVHVQTRGRRERLLALLTSVRAFPVVQVLVIFQAAARRERLLTLATAEHDERRRSQQAWSSFVTSLVLVCLFLHWSVVVVMSSYPLLSS